MSPTFNSKPIAYDSILFLQPRHLVNIQAVEGGADMKEEHAEDKDRNQQVDSVG
jgi:hypothetical protein